MNALQEFDYYNQNSKKKNNVINFSIIINSYIGN